MRFTVLRYAYCMCTCIHEGICISITITNIPSTTSTSPSSGSRWQQQQQQQQEAPSSDTSGKHAKMWLSFWYLLLPWLTGTRGVFKDHFCEQGHVLLPQVFIPSSFLYGFPLRHRMQQTHHFLVAKLLREVVGCLASVDPSWWGHCCLLQPRPSISW